MSDGGTSMPPGLDLATRKALVHLVKGPYMDSERHRELWSTMRHNRDLIEVYLAGLCLELIIDEEWGVAYVREDEAARENNIHVVRRMSLSQAETYLVLHLRRLVTEASGTGQRVVISHEELRAHMENYKALRETDHSGHNRLVENAIHKLRTKHILEPIGRDTVAEDLRRYEVAPVLKILFGPDEVKALVEAYKAIADGSWEGTLSADEEGDDEEGDDGE